MFTYSSLKKTSISISGPKIGSYQIRQNVFNLKSTLTICIFFSFFVGKHAMDHERPYFCVNCDARFSTRKKWENHLPKHSSEAPFVCKECGKGFKWKHALTAHSVIHAPEKKFLCQECGFSTSHMSTFKIHNRMHSGNLMKCDVKNCTFQVK